MSAGIAKIQIARKELGLHDDDYRATLERLTNKTSAKDLTDIEIDRVLADFKRRGWKPKPKVVQGGKTAKPAARRAPADHPSAKKARALWISLYQLGAITDPSEAALESFVDRQMGIQRLQWADQQKMYKVIEGLKKIAERHGWCGGGTDDVRALKRFLVEAQVRILAERHNTVVPDIIQSSIDNADEAALERMADQLGRQIRGRSA